MKRRTAKEMDDALSKTLYVRLPHTIKSSDEIRELFPGDVKIRMPRQSSRYCHVVFENVEEKMKNLKNIKKLVIEGKHILACPPRKNARKDTVEKKEKKVRVPQPQPEAKVTKTLHISNIKAGTKSQEIMDAFPGCRNIFMLKSKATIRSAVLKLGSKQLAGEYLRKKREWPVVRGNRLVIGSDNRKQSKSGNKKSTELKIYNGDSAEPSQKKAKKSAKQMQKESRKASQSSDEDDDEVAEDSTSDEDVEESTSDEDVGESTSDDDSEVEEE